MGNVKSAALDDDSVDNSLQKSHWNNGVNSTIQENRDVKICQGVFPIKERESENPEVNRCESKKVQWSRPTINTKRKSKTEDIHGAFNKFQSPMPKAEEIEEKFVKILNSLDIPPEKARILWQYDNEKKWELICDQKRKLLRDSTSTQVLRNLEISLRTNNIEWVLEFLNADNNGIDVLINYLVFRQITLSYEDMYDGSSPCSSRTANGRDTASKRSKQDAKLNLGEAEDDVHMCIRCLRAIMNNKEALSRVLNHKEAINAITLSLYHKNYKTKALVLELLAAVCLVKGGHELILRAFDHFKSVCHESRRFETLMGYFKNPDAICTEFMGACMQFINVVVHCVEDPHFRIYLQYEFNQLGLDCFLENLRLVSSEDIEIDAYLDNVFDVNALLEDSCTKHEALEQVLRLEDELEITREKNQELQRDALLCQMKLEERLGDLLAEKEELQHREKQCAEEFLRMKQTLTQTEQEAKKRLQVLQNVISEMETKMEKDTRTICAVTTAAATITTTAFPDVQKPALPPPSFRPAANVPLPPPPPPSDRTSFIPPPPAPPPAPKLSREPCEPLVIKEPLQPKYKLPMLHWTVLKPNEIRGTVFNEINDEKLYGIIDFASFEEQFKMCVDTVPNGTLKEMEQMTVFGSKRFKKPDCVTLLEHNRLRNLAISRRKLDLPMQAVSKAINTFDLGVLPLELVEVLQRMVPTEQEHKAYLNYEKEKKNPSHLTDEDRFLMSLCKISRLNTKLNIMHYLGAFTENLKTVTPQIRTIMVASHEVRNSKKLQKLLEIILAFGNYLNSSKRGSAYGFRLQSIDALTDVRSHDKRTTLFHYIVYTIKEKFPEIHGIEVELCFVYNAAQVCLENLITDVGDLEKGMDLIKKEYQLQKESKDDKNSRLKEFLCSSEEKVKEMSSNFKIANEAFIAAAEYFGENTRGLTSKVFFSYFVRMARMYKQAEQDLESRKTGERGDDAVSPASFDKRQQQQAVINELKHKNSSSLAADKKSSIQQQEVYDGVLEDILLGLKSEPYRRVDALRRSQKKNASLLSSRNSEDAEF